MLVLRADIAVNYGANANKHYLLQYIIAIYFNPYSFHMTTNNQYINLIYSSV